MELFNKLADSIRDVTNNSKLTIELNSKLIGDLGLESIDFLDLVSEIENSIGLELDFKEVVQYAKEKSDAATDIKSITVQTLVDFIQAHQAKA